MDTGAEAQHELQPPKKLPVQTYILSLVVTAPLRVNNGFWNTLSEQAFKHFRRM